MEQNQSGTMLETRRVRRFYMFKKSHRGNNRKNTRGRYHQLVPVKDKEGNFTGKCKLIWHNAAHSYGGN